MARKTFNLIEAMNTISKIKKIDVNQFQSIEQEDGSGTKFNYTLKGSSASEFANLGALPMFKHLLDN